MSETQSPGFFSRQWKKLKLLINRLGTLLKLLWEQLNILNFIARIAVWTQELILSFEGVLLLVIGGGIALSVYGISYEKVRLTCAVGLFWLTLFLLIFMLSAASKEWIGEFKEQVYEDTQQVDSETWYVWLINSLVLWLLKGVHSAMNTIMGVSITLAYILTELHASAATGDFQLLWQKESWSYLDIAFIIIAPLVGIYSDLSQIKAANKQRSGITLVFGIALFFLSFTFLITGLVGGEEAVLALDFILYNPIQWLFQELPNVPYEQSSAYRIISSMGTIFFLFLYFIVPLNLSFIGYEQVQVHRREETDNKKMPLLAAQGLLYFSIAFLSIVAYVAWQQGWIASILTWLLYIIIKVFQLLSQFFHWITSLF